MTAHILFGIQRTRRQKLLRGGRKGVLQSEALTAEPAMQAKLNDL